MRLGRRYSHVSAVRLCNLLTSTEHFMFLFYVFCVRFTSRNSSTPTLKRLPPTPHSLFCVMLAGLLAFCLEVQCWRSASCLTWLPWRLAACWSPAANANIRLRRAKAETWERSSLIAWRCCVLVHLSEILQLYLTEQCRLVHFIEKFIHRNNNNNINIYGAAHCSDGSSFSGAADVGHA